MKEWYKMTNYKPNNCGGYESEVISDYAQSNFTDVLETTFSDEVVLYSSDLTKSQKIRCIIQDNTADTALKSMERNLLAQIGTVKSGMYVYFENSYWIVDGRPGNNKSYEKVTVKLCQYNLRWQTSDYLIHERPVNIASASKYDVGETGSNTILLSSNNYTVLIGYDENALELDGMRVFIDKRKSNPRRVFKFTRTDDVLYDFGEQGSILAFIADKKEFNDDVDNPDLRICDYHDPISTNEETTDEMADLSCTISGGNSIRIGRKKTFSVKFADENPSFTWNVVSNFNVIQSSNDNTIELQIDDKDSIASLILLQVIVNGNIVKEHAVEVVESY